jgi:hypothetical protein
MAEKKGKESSDKGATAVQEYSGDYGPKGTSGRGSAQAGSQPSEQDSRAHAERENAAKADQERWSTPANAPVLPRVNQRDDIELYGVNKEGYVAASPEPLEGEEGITIVEARPVLGYGGPINVTSERGDYKAFGGDIIYDLSDGKRYVLARQLAIALGTTIPEPNKDEVRLLEEQAFGWQEAKRRAIERGDATEDEMTGTVGSTMQEDETRGRGKPYTGQGSAVERHTGSHITGQGEPGPGRPSGPGHKENKTGDSGQAGVTTPSKPRGDGFDEFK